MGARQTGRSPYKGIAILADGITPDNLTDQGAGLTDSSYSQAGPRPGNAVASSTRARLDVEVSGAQQVPLDVRVTRAGLPGRVGVGVTWKTRDDDNFGFRDLASPNWANHWIAAEWTDTLAWNLFDIVSSPKTGDVVVLYAQSAAATESVYARRFEYPTVDETTNPQAAPTQTAKWSSAVRASRNGSAASVFGDLGQWRQVAGCALPSGRILCIASLAIQQLRVYASDDGGGTWSIHAVAEVPNSLIGGAGFTRRRAVYYRGEIAVFDATQGIGTSVEHVASSDLGTTFQPVDSPFTGYEHHAVATIGGDGGIAFVYLRSSDFKPAIRVLSSAFQPLDSATEVLIDSTVVCDDIAVVSDAPGRLWAIGRLTASDEVRVWASADGGATWEHCRPSTTQGALFLSHDTASKIGNFAACMSRGWCVLAHNWSASPGNEDGSIGTLWSGGWGSVGHNPGSLGVGPIPSNSRPGWGQTTPTGTTPTQSAVGIPIELPADVGPWVNGGTVAPTLVSPGEVDFTLAAQTGWCELDPAGTAGAAHAALIEMWVATGNTGVGTLQAGFDLRIANGAASRRVEVRLGSSTGGFRVVDAAASTTIQDVTWDVTAPTQFLVAIDATGHLVLAYRRPWHTRWLRAALLEGASVLTDGGAGPTTNRIRFGATAAASATIRVRQWHHAQLFFGPGGAATDGALSFGFRATAGTDALAMTHRVGGLLSGSPTPLPEVGDQGLQEAFLAATRGPGVLAESYTIDPVYDHGVDRLFPTISPSPGETWRSTDLTEQLLTFDLGEDTRLGPIWHLLLGVFGANLKTVVLNAKTSAAGSFSTVGTYNGAQGFEGLSFERNGDWIRPASGTSSASRWLERNEAAGGIAILDTGGTPVALRIAANGPGRWSDPSVANTLLPEFRLEGVSGAPTSGLCDIVFPAGVRPIRFTATNPPTQYLRYWQVQIPVQTVPEAYYEIGTLFLGTTAIFGKRWSRGWTRSMLPNTARRASRYGVIRKRRDGPPAMRWSLGWPDGVSRRALLAASSPDYIGVGGSGHADVPVAAVNDVLGTLFAVLEETDGGERPVVALDSIPDGLSTSVTINERLRFLYGTLDGNGQYNNVAGRDERIGDDFGRIDPISISELVK